MKILLNLSIFISLIFNFTVNTLAQSSGDKVISLQFNDKQSIRDMHLKRIHEYVKKIKEKKEISVNEDASYLLALKGLQNKDIFKKNAAERREIIRSIIGKEQYDIIENYLKGFLEKGNYSQKMSALTILGPGLFSVSSINKIKEHMFLNDPSIQFQAIVNLVYLDVEGMQKLLGHYTLVGNLSYPLIIESMQALGDTNAPELERIAFGIMLREDDPFAVQKVLESIEGKESYLKALQMVFFSDRFPVSNNKELSKSEERENCLNRYILLSLYKHWKKVEEKDKLLSKITPLVENQHDGIYLYSGFIINKYGNAEQKDFMKQIAQKAEDKGKKQFLERVMAGKQE